MGMPKYHAVNGRLGRILIVDDEPEVRKPVVLSLLDARFNGLLAVIGLHHLVARIKQAQHNGLSDLWFVVHDKNAPESSVHGMIFRHSHGSPPCSTLRAEIEC